MNPGKAGRTRGADCAEFMAGHSEYMDGLLSPVMAARLSAHAVACDSCGRYDRIVRKGRDLVSELPPIEPSDDFELRLQHRIFHIDDAPALEPRTPGAAAALGVAAAIALLAWSPMLVTSNEDDVVASSAPSTIETIAQEPFTPSPLIGQAGWYPVSMPAGPAHESASLLAAFPGPYSPLVVSPPAHRRSVRTVSAEYLSVD